MRLWIVVATEALTKILNKKKKQIVFNETVMYTCACTCARCTVFVVTLPALICRMDISFDVLQAGTNKL